MLGSLDSPLGLPRLAKTVRMIAISTANPYDYPLDYAAVKAAARTVLDGEHVRAAKIGLAFVDRAHIHRLNKQFLDHDEPTDVITFPYSSPKAAKLEGEIVIGYDVAEEYAADRGHEVAIELLLYVIHGCLHLCGYDDTTAKAAKLMRKKEREYLAKINLPDIADDS
jgi:probable rRNA maturation factor